MPRLVAGRMLEAMNSVKLTQTKCTRRYRAWVLAACAGVAAVMFDVQAQPKAAKTVTEAEVISVSPRRSPGRGVSWRGRVMVRLDSGSEHRLTLRRPLPQVGDRLPVVVIADNDDGGLSVRPVR